MSVGAAVLPVLGRLGAAAALRNLLLVSSQQSLDLRRDLPLIHGRAPLLVLQKRRGTR